MIQLIRRAAWAPILVLVVHRLVGMTPWRQPLDFWMHFSGGLAAAYLAWHAATCFEYWIGTLTRTGRVLFSFSAACTIGVFWEFAELASDVLRGTHIQHDLHETMRDLIADACGAAITLTLMAWKSRTQR
ncbi:MAG: hypothetical protein JNG86_00040 [Verrucomicrobiaceae bacterium]|nr:hypothetical protein [Verrucomicrobiaceae bacterium]